MLGQDEAAIDLLVEHLRQSGGGSPLPYLKLLEIHRRRDERRDYERIEKAIKYIEAHFDRQPELKEVADHIGLSEFHFQRLFSGWVGDQANDDGPSPEDARAILGGLASSATEAMEALGEAADLEDMVKA